MYFAWLTYSFTLVRDEKWVLLFPNFQRSFDRYRPPAFWNGSAQVRAVLFLPNFSMIIFQRPSLNSVWKSICFRKNWPHFFEADGKDSVINHTHQFSFLFYLTASFSTSNFFQRTTHFFKRGRKDKGGLSNEQEKRVKIADYQWNISQIRIPGR